MADTETISPTLAHKMVLTTTTTAAPQPLDRNHQVALLAHFEALCNETISKDQPPLDPSCPATWDGILCWDRVPAGHTVTHACPIYFFGFDPLRNASKQCTQNGTWFWNQNTGTFWTNFSQCYSPPIPPPNVTNETIERYMPTLKLISEVGYAASLISLVAAFIILASIKKLHCPRNVLHMHLFVSFVMRAFMSLLKDTMFVMGLGLSSDVLILSEGTYFRQKESSNWSCKMIISLWQYFIMANYSWILMEGLYLHNLIFLALFSDSSSITLYIVLGWGLPALFVVPWTVCRALLENTLCWTTNENNILFLLIRVPTTASIVLNFILFINIIRVLLHKLKSSVCEETKTYRRWAKSTLVLVPLFGVHYMIFLGLSVGGDTVLEIIWLFCNQLFASFQGLFVAILYCFLNGEVRTELSKKWNHFSFSDWLESLPFAGRDTMANGILPGGGRFLARGRHNHPRASCYSSTSFTSVSVLPAGVCCNPNKKRGSLAPAAPAAPAAAGGAGHAGGGGRAVLHGSSQGGLAELTEVPDFTDKDPTEVKELSPKNQDRRWSVSDYNVENNAIELQSITCPKNFSVKL